jgi:hypothetical protein
MRFPAAITALVMLFVLSSCNDQAIYKHTAHAADSLNGALSLAKQQLLQSDTIVLQKAITKFKEYSAFVTLHVNDTLTKVEADNLQKFTQSGRQLEVFDMNRKVLAERAKLISTQLIHLSQDCEKKANSADVLQAYYKKELEQAQLVLSASADHLAIFQGALSDFKSCLPALEALIMKRNRGELPLIIKDTLQL